MKYRVYLESLLILIWLIGLLVFNPQPSLAAKINHQWILTKFRAVQYNMVEPGVTQRYGQIKAISAHELCLDSGKGIHKYPISSKAQLFCNGLPAVWRALTPITGETFFEAKLIINSQNEVIWVSGLYDGETCIIKEWSKRKEHIFIKLAPVESGPTVWKMVEKTAKLPRGFWLASQTEIYVLYNYKNNIRAIFLPE